VGPLKVLEASYNQVTLKWKHPSRDGGAPIESYDIEMKKLTDDDEWTSAGTKDTNLDDLTFTVTQFSFIFL